MIAAKLKGQEVTEVAQPHMARVIDLREALKKSVAEKQAPPAAAPGPLPVGKKPPAAAGEGISAVRKTGEEGAVIVERGGARLERLSGQFVLNFETRELNETVRVMTGRSADEWLAVALEYEAEGMNRAQAIDEYERAFCVDPARPDALINCGTLYYEDGNLEKASEYFRQALVLDPENALAHFNLGSVLDETGHLDAARQHLRQAVRLNPIYPDAHYNLAFVCEKLKAYAEAKQHWQAYVRLDPTAPCPSYAPHPPSPANTNSTKSAGTT